MSKSVSEKCHCEEWSVAERRSNLLLQEPNMRLVCFASPRNSLRDLAMVARNEAITGLFRQPPKRLA